MPHDAEKVSETRAWFLKSASDLHAAAHDLTAVPPLLEDVVFHCQQAVEKALKGYLTWHDQRFRKTHSIEEVGEQCLTIDASLKPEGMNLVTSAGKVAEQTVFHLHLHVVPRWQRDGFGQIWPTQGKFEDADLEDVADRIREACNG